MAGIKLADDDRVTSMCVIEKGGDLLVVTEFGFGKRTAVDEYPAKGRATGGIATTDIRSQGKIGKIAAARVVQEDDEVTFMSTGGIVLRVKVSNISRSGRSTRGVHIMDLGENDRVATVAVLASNDLRKVGVEANGNGADQA